MSKLQNPKSQTREAEPMQVWHGRVILQDVVRDQRTTRKPCCRILAPPGSEVLELVGAHRGQARPSDLAPAAAQGRRRRALIALRLADAAARKRGEGGRSAADDIRGVRSPFLAADVRR